VALLSTAEFPVILSGGGVVMGDGVDAVVRLAEHLSAPVISTYLHNDSFPKSHPLWCGPIGYQGSKAAMQVLAKADVVLAIGTRLGPFGTLPQHGIEYWPKDARLIQVEANPRRIGLVKQAAVGVCGDAKAATVAILDRLQTGNREIQAHRTREARLDVVKGRKGEWEAELDRWGQEASSPVSPRRALRELERAMPADAMVTTDIGNICSVSNSYLRFERPNSFFAR
jgi:sulfoacetaldehyde acetyltransferase